jgi:hypothetical protein
LPIVVAGREVVMPHLEIGFEQRVEIVRRDAADGQSADGCA